MRDVLELLDWRLFAIGFIMLALIITTIKDLFTKRRTRSETAKNTSKPEPAISAPQSQAADESRNPELNELIQKANQGDLEAINSLAAIYMSHGNTKKAEKYWEKAADRGHPEAQFRFSTLRWMAGEMEMAEIYAKRSADQGFHEAQRNLGFLYYNQKKFDLGIAYFKMAADGEDGHSQCFLGRIYLDRGQLDSAEVYLKLAAEKGFTDAWHGLGKLYTNIGNFEEAEKYLKMAVSRGHLDAFIDLSVFYLSVRKDKSLAYKYMLSAAQKGSVQAQNYLQEWNQYDTEDEQSPTFLV